MAGGWLVLEQTLRVLNLSSPSKSSPAAPGHGAVCMTELRLLSLLAVEMGWGSVMLWFSLFQH